MAVRFDNGADFLSLTGIPTLTSPFTWMTWAYVASDTGGSANIIGGFIKVASSLTVFSLEGNGAAVNLTITDRETSPFSAIGTSMSVATWRHVTLVRTATPGWISYLNGVQDSTLAATVAPSPVTEQMRVGLDDNVERLDGRVEAMKFWTVQLTAPEILAEMARYDPVLTANNWAWWPLTVHTDVADHSGNARHWTANGTLTTEAGPGGITEGGEPVIAAGGVPSGISARWPDLRVTPL
jgi:hypothetical protein